MPAGHGIIGMRERAAALGGQLTPYQSRSAVPFSTSEG